MKIVNIKKIIKITLIYPPRLPSKIAKIAKIAKILGLSLR